MNNSITLRGLSTISFWAADLEAAKKWYTELLGVHPYFERPGYFEFRLGDTQAELGVIDIIEVTYKNAGELVTSADFASDQIIREAIASAYPKHGILSKETADGVWAKNIFEGPLWIIDPLDGTVNYARNLPDFAISVAIAVDGVVWAGAVHAPDLGVTYVGIRGGGARCNGEQLHVHRFETLSEAVIGTGFPHDKEKVHPALARVNLLTTETSAVWLLRQSISVM